MNGAESLIRTLTAHGVDMCFANPGTSEMHLVQAVDAVDEMRAVLCLFEGVCTGAADGYARMKGMPAITLLHLGAGLGNGIANLHNCRRAGTPLINVVGDHAIHHIAWDAPLTADIEAVAKGVSAWIRTSRTSMGVGLDAADAVRAACSPSPDPRGGIATLILPADCSWGEGRPQPRRDTFDAVVAPARIPAGEIEAAAGLIGRETMLLIDGSGLGEAGTLAAGRIAAATGCSLYTPTFPARVEAGPELPVINRLPYFPEQIIELMAPVKRLVLIGAQAPVSFFAYEGLPGYLVPDTCEVTRLAHRHEDVAGASRTWRRRRRRRGTGAAARQRPAVPKVRSTRVPFARSWRHGRAAASSQRLGGGGRRFRLQRWRAALLLNLTGGSIGQRSGGAWRRACLPDRGYSPCSARRAMYPTQSSGPGAEGANVTAVVSRTAEQHLGVEYRRLGITTSATRRQPLGPLSPDLMGALGGRQACRVEADEL